MPVKGVVAGRILCKKEQIVSLRIMNVISKDVVLAKNTPIGRTELTEEVQERKARNKP